MTLFETQDHARREGRGIAPALGAGRVRSGSQAIRLVLLDACHVTKEALQ